MQDVQVSRNGRIGTRISKPRRFAGVGCARGNVSSVGSLHPTLNPCHPRTLKRHLGNPNHSQLLSKGEKFDRAWTWSVWFDREFHHARWVKLVGRGSVRKQRPNPKRLLVVLRTGNLPFAFSHRKRPTVTWKQRNDIIAHRCCRRCTVRYIYFVLVFSLKFGFFFTGFVLVFMRAFTGSWYVSLRISCLECFVWLVERKRGQCNEAFLATPPPSLTRLFPGIRG